MMKILPGNMKKIVLFWGAATLLTACTSQLETPIENIDDSIIVEEQQAPVFYASIGEEANTKVYLDEDYKVLWTEDDRISVFNENTYNQEYRFDGNTGDNAGTFSIVPDGKVKTSNPLDYAYAIYPYSSGTSISNTGVLTVNFPAAQTYTATTFGLGANTMVAVTDDSNFQFKNACGYLMLKLYGTSVGTTIKTISIKGNNHEKIAGEATISMSLGGTPAVSMTGSATEEITLTCTDAVTIGEASNDYTQFWFALPPVTFTKGFTITVTDEDGRIFRQSTSSSLEIVRSYAKKMAPLPVTLISVPIAVPLGLSVKWASFNIGASSPEGFGYYYAWGEISRQFDYSWASYKWCNGTNTSLTKYNSVDMGYGTIDNKTQLDPDDDVASARLGDGWRMPTRAELEELVSDCTWTWMTLGGHNVYKVTGPNNNYIFLPCPGWYRENSLKDGDDYGTYWSSTRNVNGNSAQWAWAITISQWGHDPSGSHRRSDGCSVRPVKE